MEKVFVGKYVKTHGIKGEIKIRSDFKYKDKVFKVSKLVIIGNQEFIINSYRKHQEYDMITLKGITDINEILPLKGSNVYVYKSDLNLDKNEYLDTDLINLDVYMGEVLVGKVSQIIALNHGKKLLVINGHYVPMELIKEIDFQKKKLVIEEVMGLL